MNTPKLLLTLAASLCALPLHVLAAGDAAAPALVADLPCSVDSVDAALTVRQLRSLRERCAQSGEIYAHALVKTNSLPLPLAPALRLAPAAGKADSEPLRAQLAVFYYLHESYPAEAGFDDLDRLIRALGTAWRIDAVQITGSVDVMESGLTFARGLAQRRAEVVGEYLRDAGLGDQVPVTIDVRAPRYDDSAAGRAEDRAAEIVIQAERRRVAPAAAVQPVDGD
ncbi:MAG TPA: hypothetical protein VGN52_24585 [Burkholderiales bacterium]|jgi:hypothetical protein